MQLDKLSKMWWTEFRRGRITVQQCAECDSTQFPPGPICRNCHAALGAQFAELTGQSSVIIATSTIQTSPMEPFADAVPYQICTFELNEGTRISLPVCRNTPPLSAGTVCEISPCGMDEVLPAHVSLTLLESDGYAKN